MNSETYLTELMFLIKQVFFKTLGTQINNMFQLIDTIMQEQSKAISEISNGNLTVKVDDKQKGIFGKINSDINQMTEKLSHLVGSIKTSLLQLDETITEIAQGNSDLQQRTSLQASQLEEASSNVQKITSSMKDSTQLSNNIKTSSNNSKETATDGSRVLKEIINSMMELKNQFEEIYGIISVIDGISFQTNLLSLNASVEAAKAGDYGRGFAVVASEVRKLAQCSSNSAKETGTLIKNTLDIVNKGSENAVEGGKSLDIILSSALDVNEQISDMAEKIRKQFDQISEISSFLQTIENTVQQNSALSEENSAATSNLAVKSQNIVKQLSAFKVD